MESAVQVPYCDDQMIHPGQQVLRVHRTQSDCRSTLVSRRTEPSEWHVRLTTPSRLHTPYHTKHIWISAFKTWSWNTGTSFSSINFKHWTIPIIIKFKKKQIGEVILVVLALARQTNSATTLDLFLPTSGNRPFYGAMVERCDGPSWLRDDDDTKHK